MLKILTEQIRFGGFLFLVLFFGLLPKRQASKMKLKTERMRQSRRRTIQGSRRANVFGFRFWFMFRSNWSKTPSWAQNSKSPTPDSRLPTPIPSASASRFLFLFLLIFIFSFSVSAWPTWQPLKECGLASSRHTHSHTVDRPYRKYIYIRVLLYVRHAQKK